MGKWVAAALTAFLAYSASAATPTFSREVVRIFQNKCQTCHHTGGIAPFPLMEYKDAKKRAGRIAGSVVDRHMPPWPPAADCGDFRADRSLSQQDIDTIKKWVDGGAPEGDPKDLPQPLTFTQGWALGAPDLALASQKPFTVPGGGDDIYRCFVLPFEASKDDYITGLEIRPDKVSVVHHGIVYLDPKGESLKLLNPNDPQPGYTCFGGPGFEGGEIIGGWAPGSVPEFLPKGIGIAVPKSARLVLQVHYHPERADRQDQTQLGVHFAKEPVTHPLHIGAVADVKNLIIPAGEPNYQISKEITLPRDVQIINVFPHMHLLGKKIGLEAILPDNSKQCLIRIDHWHFHWQGFYSYKNFVSLPAGTRLKLTGVYDNSEDNPHQPNHPPKEVRWGDRTVDEMFLSFFSFIVP